MFTTSQAEKKIGLIPRIIVPGRMGLNEYALLVTDKRSILIHEKGSASNIAGALGGSIGAAIASAAATRKSFDYENENPDSFALNPKNIVIPHDSLDMIWMKKALLNPVYRVRVKYRTSSGKDKKVKGFLRPPGEHVKQRKQQGTGKKQIHYDYAKKVQDVYRQALSPPKFQAVINPQL